MRLHSHAKLAVRSKSITHSPCLRIQLSLYTHTCQTFQLNRSRLAIKQRSRRYFKASGRGPLLAGPSSMNSSCVRIVQMNAHQRRKARFNASSREPTLAGRTSEMYPFCACSVQVSACHCTVKKIQEADRVPEWVYA